MSKFDISSTIRWSKSFPSKALARRPDDALPFATLNDIGGAPVLLDTCVYIDRLQGKLPDIAGKVMDSRHNYHSSACIQELAHTIGILDPKDKRTAKVITAVSDVIDSMPEHRILTPDIDVLGRAAVLNGALSRLQGYQADQKLRSLNDCTVFLLAMKEGITILTGNIADFDYCLQIMPKSRVLLYRSL